MSGLLIFDGDCGFCTTAATWIERRWTNSGNRIIPWQFMAEPELSQMGLCHDDVSRKVYWHDASGVYGGERAIAKALRDARSPWRGFGYVIDLWPIRLLARPVYLLVARYRHVLPGGTPACRMR